jgi:hypothetical protein
MSLVCFKIFLRNASLAQHLRTGLPREIIYADDIVLDHSEGLKEKLRKWKEGLETKGLKVLYSELLSTHAGLFNLGGSIDDCDTCISTLLC